MAATPQAFVIVRWPSLKWVCKLSELLVRECSPGWMVLPKEDIAVQTVEYNCTKFAWIPHFFCLPGCEVPTCGSSYGEMCAGICQHSKMLGAPSVDQISVFHSLFC